MFCSKLPRGTPTLASYQRFVASSSRIVPPLCQPCQARSFSATAWVQTAEIRAITDLPQRTSPRFLQSTKPGGGLLSLKWPQPPRNLLLVQKLYSPGASTKDRSVSNTYRQGNGNAVFHENAIGMAVSLHTPYLGSSGCTPGSTFTERQCPAPSWVRQVSHKSTDRLQNHTVLTHRVQSFVLE